MSSKIVEARVRKNKCRLHKFRRYFCSSNPFKRQLSSRMTYVFHAKKSISPVHRDWKFSVLFIVSYCIHNRKVRCFWGNISYPPHCSRCHCIPKSKIRKLMSLKDSVQGVAVLTLHLKQSGCQSLSKALNLGADDSPTPGAIGFLQA